VEQNGAHGFWADHGGWIVHLVELSLRSAKDVEQLIDPGKQSNDNATQTDR
jgi:hypothetical protein